LGGATIVSGTNAASASAQASTPSLRAKKRRLILRPRSAER
jgi:hypothetical protein